jgi:hypothetical protein
VCGFVLFCLGSCPISFLLNLMKRSSPAFSREKKASDVSVAASVAASIIESVAYEIDRWFFQLSIRHDF